MKHSAFKFSAALFIITLFALATSPAFAWRGNLGWTYDARFPISSSVAVAGNIVIAGDNAGYLHAIHMASGQTAWLHEGFHSIVGLPAVSGQMVVFAQADGTITAVSLSNGELIWQHNPQTGGAAETVMEGVAIGDGRVFFARSDGRLLALSASNGAVLWTYESTMGLRSAPIFSNGFVFLGEFGGRFSALNPQTGERVWGGGAGGAINTPATHDGHVFFSSWDGSVNSVLIRGVIPQWNTNVGVPVSTPPAIGGDRLFVGTADGNVVALSRANGDILWRFDTAEGTVVGTPVVADGLVFVASGMGNIFALDAASGAVRSTFSTEAHINGSPAFAGGILFLGSSEARVYAVR